MAEPDAAYSPRYETLDAWRGVASLTVCLGHAGIVPPPLTSAHTGLAVQLFFVVSGYCMTAASEKALATGMPVLAFFKRRVRRIGPPYLASVFLTIAAWFVVGARAGGLEGGLAQCESVSWLDYLRNFTITQWTSVTAEFARGLRIYKPPYANASLLQAPYWSLGYEEQYYVFLVALLAVCAWTRRRGLAALLGVATLGAVFWLRRAPGSVTGLLVDYWPQFACGIVLHYRLCSPLRADRRRALDVLLVIAAATITLLAWSRGELTFTTDRYQFFGQLTICATFAVLLVALRGFDGRLARTRPVRVLGALGAFSYSLYLVHFPLMALFDPGRVLVGGVVGDGAARGLLVAVVVACAYGFYRVFERPFLARREAPSPLSQVEADGPEEDRLEGGR